MDDKCMSIYAFELFFILNWHVFDLIIGKPYLIGCYIDLRAMAKHNKHEQAKQSNVGAI